MKTKKKRPRTLVWRAPAEPSFSSVMRQLRQQAERVPESRVVQRQAEHHSSAWSGEQSLSPRQQRFGDLNLYYDPQ